MSFSNDVREEIARSITDRDRQFACLYGILLYSRIFTQEQVVLQSESPVFARLMPMLLCPECSGHLLGHIHPLPALVVQAESSAAACRSSAAFSTGGSSLPRTEALRRIPRHAFGLK